MTGNPNPSPAEIVAALQRGGIVEALKLVVAAKANGSSAAKKVANHLGASTRPSRASPPSSTRAELSPGEVPRSSSDIWLLLVIAALCIAYYLFGR
jgi:hypothetical protein